MEPLAFKIRPKNLDEFVGQEHLVGENKPLRIAINEKHLFSFHGNHLCVLFSLPQELELDPSKGGAVHIYVVS